MRLSIITVSYNEEKNIERTLKSIYSQTYSDYEHIIIDGASIDNTTAIIKSFIHDNTTFISEKDKGIYNAMNKGIAFAKGDYVFFLNAGDVLCSIDSLEKAFCNIIDEDMVVFSHFYVRNNGKKILVDCRRVDLPYQVEECTVAHHQSTIFKRSLFDRFGYYDESYKISGDYDLYARFLYGTGITFKKVPFIISEFYEGGVSTNRLLDGLNVLEDDMVRKINIYNTDLFKKRFFLRKIRLIKKYPLFFINIEQLIKIIKA
jgi:glycosyltransferase involved in cell wall biosynthesis